MPAQFPEWFPALIFLRHLSDILSESVDIVFGTAFIVGAVLSGMLWGTRHSIVVGYILLVLWLWMQPNAEPSCQLLVHKDGQLLCEKTK